MSYQTIVELLEKLRTELKADELDDSTLSLFEQFDADIQSAIQRKADEETSESILEETESLVDTAKRLETHFAAEHPVAESALREIINALAKMGI